MSALNKGPLPKRHSPGAGALTRQHALVDHALARQQRGIARDQHPVRGEADAIARHQVRRAHHHLLWKKKKARPCSDTPSRTASCLEPLLIAGITLTSAGATDSDTNRHLGHVLQRGALLQGREQLAATQGQLRKHSKASVERVSEARDCGRRTRKPVPPLEYGLPSPSWAQREFSISTEVKQHQKTGYSTRAACPK